MPLGREVFGHHTALVGRQAVPHRDHFFASEAPFEILQERDEGLRVVVSGQRSEEQARSRAVPAIREGRRHRHLGPVEGVDQDRRLAFGCPGAPDRRPLGDAALVLEDEPGLAAPGVFFSAGQVWATHCRTASSFRSRARLAGRWSVQFLDRRIFQTCPG